MRMLAAAGARLSRPMLVACLTQWREDWQENHLSAGQQAHAATLSRSPSPSPSPEPEPDPDPESESESESKPWP